MSALATTAKLTVSAALIATLLGTLACIGMAFVSDDSTAGGGASYRLDDLEAEGLAEFAAHCTPAGNFRYWDFRLREKKPETSGGLFG